MIHRGYGLTFANVEENNISSISEPIIVAGNVSYIVTFTNGDRKYIDTPDGQLINKIEKSDTDGAIDTFKITYENGKTDTFELLNGKHTYDDYDLVMTSLYIPEPEPKVQRIDLPFASGTVDLTDATGETPYNDREGLQFEFGLVDGNAENWATAIQNISMFVHGKAIKVIPDHDKSYYYLARLSVDTQKSNKTISSIVLKGTADPFKYDVIASNEPWKWSPFRFPDGIIQNTNDIRVDGDTTFHINAGGVLTSPAFIVSKTEGLGIRYGNKILSMPKTGRYQFPQIKVGTNSETITFTGNGIVSIEYRGRYL